MSLLASILVGRLAFTPKVDSEGRFCEFAGQAAVPAPTPVGASASPTSEPGDHAVSTGRVLSVNPPSLLVVESPGGSVQVVVPDAVRYTVGDVVQVRTTARAMP